MKRSIAGLIVCLLIPFLFAAECEGESDNDERVRICVDYDDDGFGDWYPASKVGTGYNRPVTGCSKAVDCDDADSSNWDMCGACTDQDGDGSYIFCNDYVTILGPDCDDSNPNVWNQTACDNCGDGDSDSFWGNCDDYDGIPGPDMCEINTPVGTNHWNSPCARCYDADGDDYYTGCDSFGYLVPGEFLGEDVCEGNPNNWTEAGCAFCWDSDGDGYWVDCDSYSGLGNGAIDYCDNNINNWTAANCAACNDADGDNRYSSCDSYNRLGAEVADACEGDPNNWTPTNCAMCDDHDGDGSYSYCDSYLGLGPGVMDYCDDPADPMDAFNWNSSGCSNCADHDGDGYYAGCDSYAGLGNGEQDYCDNDINNYSQTACASCLDTDGDGWWADCGAYATIDGPDCAPGDSAHWQDCGLCQDNDLDDRGPNCDLGGDCDDSLTTGAACFDGCSTYYPDADDDGYGDPALGEDRCSMPAGFIVQGGDCDDLDKDNWDMCATCLDTDGDTWYAGCNLYTTRSGPDCDPASAAHWNDCGTCADVDGDGWGAGCNQAGDCDDYVETGVSCHDACQTFYADGDGDGHGTTAPTISRCAPPVGYAADNIDCDDADTDNWISCGACVDNDGDNRFIGCDRYVVRAGPDCNDLIINVWTNCSNCPDNDGDGHGRGTTCDTASDCDDSLDTGAGCFNACNTYYFDNDGDGVGGTIYATAQRCAPYGRYVADGTDCSDLDVNNWTAAGCANCDDGDNDGWYVDCDAYVTIGDTHDCIDTDPDHWKDCGKCADVDGDDRGVDCDRGPDCDDGDNACFDTCNTYYRDQDGDAHGDLDGDTTYGCDVIAGYTSDSTDCNDLITNVWTDCGNCSDGDGDGYGADNGPGDHTCDLDPDCDDSSNVCHVGCGTYYSDSDGDSYGDPNNEQDSCLPLVGFTTDNTDCDDLDTDNWDKCATCADSDLDSWYVACDRYVDRDGPDCDDAIKNVWTDCSDCPDADGDDYGAGGSCDLASDCDDTADTGDSCHNACQTFYRDADSDTHGVLTTTISRCGAPVGYTNTSDDNCDAATGLNTNNWTAANCAACGDADGDLWHVSCDRYHSISGPDCDDDIINAWNTCATCLDGDGDGYGAGTCNSTGDCDDMSDTCHAGCGSYYPDADSDDYGDGSAAATVKCPAAAPVGYVTDNSDCDDGDDTCYNTCNSYYPDNDGDSYGSSSASATVSCPDSAPAGYVTNNSDCSDVLINVWDKCGTCSADTDLDGWGRGSTTTSCNLQRDCLNTDKDVYPDAPEICDGKDNQCFGNTGYGIVDEYPVCMVSIDGGTYHMGDASAPFDGSTDERPLHEISLPTFYLDFYEVTNARYKPCVDAGDCDAPDAGTHYGVAGYEDHPVRNVDWEDADIYCRTYAGKRLPTEAEWEYAARGGLDLKRYPWGDVASTSNANYNGTDTVPVGTYAANGFALYDMVGNVSEFVYDYYSATYYSTVTDPVTDPTGPASGTARVYRGGSYASDATGVRNAERYWSADNMANIPAAGFRCADDP